jgi:hypothetical protein
MKIANLIDKIKGVATEANDNEICRTIIVVQNEDGTYMEVTSDEDN